MSLPTPDDPKNAPVWENYIVAQVVQASLGQIPSHALAVGVEVSGARVQLLFQLSEDTDADEADIKDIVSDLEALVGHGVNIVVARQLMSEREISPSDGVRWTFLART